MKVGLIACARAPPKVRKMAGALIVLQVCNQTRSAPDASECRAAALSHEPVDVDQASFGIKRKSILNATHVPKAPGDGVGADGRRLCPPSNPRLDGGVHDHPREDRRREALCELAAGTSRGGAIHINMAV